MGRGWCVVPGVWVNWVLGLYLGCTDKAEVFGTVENERGGGCD